MTEEREALTLYNEGRDAFRAGDQETSREKNERALELACSTGDREAEALALVGLSRVAFRDGDYARVRALATEARELVKGLGLEADAGPLHMLAAGTRLDGDYDRAAALYAESLELNRRRNEEPFISMELHNLGFVELHRGRSGEAERLFAEAAGMGDTDDPYDSAMKNLAAAALAASRGEEAEAQELLGRVESRLAEAGIVLDPDDAFEVEWLRSRLG